MTYTFTIDTVGGEYGVAPPDHRFNADDDRCVCGGVVVYFEDDDHPETNGEGCEVAGHRWERWSVVSRWAPRGNTRVERTGFATEIEATAYAIEQTANDVGAEVGADVTAIRDAMDAEIGAWIDGDAENGPRYGYQHDPVAYARELLARVQDYDPNTGGDVT